MKWLLRVAAFFPLLLGFALFLIPQTVYLNIVGLTFAGSLGCLVLAEMVQD